MVALFYSFGNLCGLCDTAVGQGLTRNKNAINTHEHITCTSTHTVDLNVRGWSLAIVELAR